MRIVNIGPRRGADQVMVGTVAKPHGIRGELKVFPASGRPDELKAYRKVALVDQAGGATRLFDIVKSGRHDRFAILELKGLTDREGAEALRGWEVRVERQSVPPPGEEACYWHELAGVAVVTGEGRSLGVARDLMHNGAHEVLVVQGEHGREYLIPVAEAFIAHRDAAGALVVTPPPGLLEMNE